jgi:FPC/CPF motif-containing protein YcgG
VTNPKKTTATADRRARRAVCPHPAVHLDGDDAAAGPGTRRHRNAVAERTFRAVAGAPDYPSVGARSVLRQDRAETHGYEDLGTAASARELLADLTRFASSIDLTAGFASFVAVFLHDASADEEEFERLLWRQLQELHDIDGAPPDPAVSSDPAHPNFAFSVAGTAFFVIGLHPAASRPARRSPRPMLIFNPHEQFDMLRAAGGDYPGTFGLRRDALLATDGYDGDVLFENLQMLRTARASGAHIKCADGMYVARIPPSARQFWHQRIRQAYDDFGQPLRLAIEASWGPLAVLAALTRPRWLLLAATAAVATRPVRL